jgi:hypothetical protein
MDKDEKKKLKNGIRPEFKDYIAIALAIFELVMPIVLIGLSIFAIILFVGTKFWLK